MTDQNNKNLSLEGIELYPLGKFTEDAYLNYSMNVIRDTSTKKNYLCNV